MASVAIRKFGGMAPRLSPSLLDGGQAQQAVNCALGGGDIRPLGGLAAEGTVGGRPPRTILRYAGGAFLCWPEPVDAVRGPVAGDTRDRTYFTGIGRPRLTDRDLALGGGRCPRSDLLLGIPAPAGPPVCVAGPADQPEPDLEGGGDGGVAGLRTVAYVTTFVSGFGEEGPPSPASNLVEALDGQAVDLFGWGGPAPRRGIARRRIYRTHTPSSGSALWQFVAEIDGLAPSCTDTVRDADLGEVLASASWQPPLAGMRGLVSLPNGILAGFEDNQLCLSEPWRPHAWPPEYRMLTDWRIAGLGVFGTTLLVLTEGCTYLVSGSHPAAMSMSRLPGHQPCLSRRGLVSTEHGVAYPSPDGLYLVGPGGGRLLTGSLLGRGDWQALAPETIHAACHDGRYFGFFEPPGPAREVPEEWLGGFLNGPALAGSPIAGRAGTGDPPAGPEEGSGFVLALAAGPSSDGPGLGWLDFGASAVQADPATGRLFLSRRDGAETRIERLEDRDPGLTYTWRSRPFRGRGPLTYGAARVEAAFSGAPPPEGERLDLRLYGDGVLRFERRITGSGPFRLPAGRRACAWEIELSGNVPVREIVLAESMEELG